jgi:hypothetical protein
MLRAAETKGRAKRAKTGIADVDPLARRSGRLLSRAALTALLLIGLSAALATSPPSAMAEPASMVALHSAEPVGRTEHAGAIGSVVLVETPRIEADADRSLDALLAVPTTRYVHVSESTDEALAAAVRKGNDPGLERPNPFRKRKIDLFRSEHPLAIGENEMLLRLRIRSKMSKAVSVELRF